MNRDQSFQKMMEMYSREAARMHQRSRNHPVGMEYSKTPAPEPIPVPPPCEESVGRGKAIDGEMPQNCEKYEKTDFSQTVGADGPVLLQDTMLHETLETFVHSKELERVVHTKGYGAFGSFQLYQSMREYTKACFLQTPSEKTPVFTRFSLAVSNRGTPDTSRNVRGFATRFYTKEGNFDLVGNHIPVFFMQDAIRFPDIIAALSPSPVNNLAAPGKFWEFVAKTPETVNMLTWLYSDAGTVKSFRYMRGFGVNTFVWVNAEGRRRYVKYHWIPLAGEEYLNREEAARFACSNPDISGEDLYNTLEKGTPAEYELCVQLMDPADAEKLSFDPLDDTKIWNEIVYPLLRVGKLTLDRNPDNYREQVERAAFSPANLVEGIELSADRMLQGRSFIYWDAQRRRLGPGFRNLEPNRSRDGFSLDRMVTSGEGVRLKGNAVRSALSKTDDFTQAGDRYRSLPEDWQARLVDNIASELYMSSASVRDCVVGYLTKADEAFGAALEKRIDEYIHP